MVAIETPAEPASATRALRAARAPSPAALNADPPSDEPVLPTVCQADIARDDLTGFRLEQYLLGPRIGQGGMGKVFRARHRHLDRTLAIKFVAADVSGLPEAQQRFERETRALGLLQHPHIVNAIDAGSCHGLMYLVTEYVDGEDLSQLVERRGPLPATEACGLIRQAARGLACLHARGFVHRDIKPSNLIVDRAGCVRILDFGLVRSAHADQQLTDAGQTVGTWDFLAPEQAHNASDVDCRCDLYGLGCTLLYLLSGSVPYGGARYATPAAKLKAHLFDMPVALDQPPAGVTPELAAIIARLVAKSPADRFASADEVVAALTPFAAQFREREASPQPPAAVRTPARSHVKQAIAVAALVGAIACGGILRSQSESRGTAPVRSSAVAESRADSPADNAAQANESDQDPATNPEPPATAPLLEAAPLHRMTITPSQTSNAPPVRLPSLSPATPRGPQRDTGH
ncbi:MAG: protein kinase [Planctomycetaceae bacterium]